MERGIFDMGTILYFVVIAAAMVALSHVLPGFHVDGWVPALLASVVLALANAILKPILFVLTLPFTILTLGLFLFILNALMLWLTAVIVPGFRIHGFLPTLLASLILSVVGMLWKALTRPAKTA
jgi:putative membrane protein